MFSGNSFHEIDEPNKYRGCDIIVLIFVLKAREFTPAEYFTITALPQS
jgi:hypothetical protein